MQLVVSLVKVKPKIPLLIVVAWMVRALVEWMALISRMAADNDGC